ncbi:hypothetical protein [Streptomyces sp. NPDC006971]|uniref:hypothetical protein n=1 Tax=Streptomyces sp. NPDC006971 TaxID=3154784 RepID=UPI003406A867
MYRNRRPPRAQPLRPPTSPPGPGAFPPAAPRWTRERVLVTAPAALCLTGVGIRRHGGARPGEKAAAATPATATATATVTATPSPVNTGTAVASPEPAPTDSARRSRGGPAKAVL